MHEIMTGSNCRLCLSNRVFSEGCCKEVISDIRIFKGWQSRKLCIENVNPEHRYLWPSIIPKASEVLSQTRLLKSSSVSGFYTSAKHSVHFKWLLSSRWDEASSPKRCHFGLDDLFGNERQPSKKSINVKRGIDFYGFL